MAQKIKVILILIGVGGLLAILLSFGLVLIAILCTVGAIIYAYQWVKMKFSRDKVPDDLANERVIDVEYEVIDD